MMEAVRSLDGTCFRIGDGPLRLTAAQPLGKLAPYAPARFVMSDRPKTLWIKEPYLAQILTRQKTIEVRVGYPNILRLRPGSPLRLNDAHPARVRRITVYPDFAALVAAEDAARIAPGMTADELLAALRALYPPDKEALGAVALEIELESEE